MAIGGLVLLVEDDPDDEELARASLRKHNIGPIARQEQDRIGSYRGGANSFVIKPIDFHQFREAVRQLGQYWLEINEPA